MNLFDLLILIFNKIVENLTYFIISFKQKTINFIFKIKKIIIIDIYTVFRTAYSYIKYIYIKIKNFIITYIYFRYKTKFRIFLYKLYKYYEIKSIGSVLENIYPYIRYSFINYKIRVIYRYIKYIYIKNKYKFNFKIFFYKYCPYIRNLYIKCKIKFKIFLYKYYKLKLIYTTILKNYINTYINPYINHIGFIYWYIKFKTYPYNIYPYLIIRYICLKIKKYILKYILKIYKILVFLGLILLFIFLFYYNCGFYYDVFSSNYVLIPLRPKDKLYLIYDFFDSLFNLLFVYYIISYYFKCYYSFFDLIKYSKYKYFKYKYFKYKYFKYKYEIEDYSSKIYINIIKYIRFKYIKYFKYFKYKFKCYKYKIKNYPYKNKIILKNFILLWIILILIWYNYSNILNFGLNLYIFFLKNIMILYNISIEQPLIILFSFFFFFTTLFSFFFLSYLGFYGVFFFNFISILFFWISALYYFLDIYINNSIYYVNIGNWLYLSIGYQISFDLIIDFISISFSFLILTIGFFVYIYTFSYFKYEPLIERLILLLNLFMISMILLVSAGNLIVMFLGWELIGLTSFFLINFWSTRINTLKAAFKAFTFNKISDLFLFFNIILIYNVTNNLDIVTLNNQCFLYENYSIDLYIFNFNFIELVSLFFIISASIKSVQICSHIWLPDSMEAPVPASALIHSATLVSAGIFLLLRFSPIINLSLVFFILPILGSITAFYGGIVAAFQSDTKKTLAYSTMSHCGFLMFFCSFNIIEYTILYLYVHGLFKALSFLCIGNINKFNKNIQDFKKMGGFFKYLPLECFILPVCLINLAGLPFTLGYQIKHLLFIGLNDNIYLYYFSSTLLILSSLTGVLYSYRLINNIFFDIKKNKKSIYFSNNKIILNSNYYTNSSISASLSISIMFFVSYVIIFFLYKFIFNKISNNNIFNYSNININNLSSFLYYSDNYFFSFISILNWFVIIVIFFILFVKWRNIYDYNNLIDFFSKIILFIFFSFLFFFILYFEILTLTFKYVIYNILYYINYIILIYYSNRFQTFIEFNAFFFKLLFIFFTLLIFFASKEDNFPFVMFLFFTILFFIVIITFLYIYFLVNCYLVF